MNSRTPASSDFPSQALDALGLGEVFAWLSELLFTPAGIRSLKELYPGMAAGEREATGRRGQEAAQVLAAEESAPVRRCADLEALLSKAAKRALSGEELAEVAGAISRIEELLAWILGRPQLVAMNNATAEVADLTDLSKLLALTIDLRGEVLDSADPSLKKLRSDIRSAERQRSLEMNTVVEKWRVQGWLENVRPTSRGGRPVLAVKAVHSGRARGVLHDRSRSGDTVFIEPEPVVAASNHIATLEAQVAHVVQRVLLECTRSVVRRRHHLEQSERVLGKIDVAFAAASWAQSCGAHWPQTNGNALLLRQLRHPLLVRQMGIEKVIPLDLDLGADFDLMVVTGPNTGGKTVVLKTVGLAAALSACGLPVCAAEGTVVPALPGIDADIGDQQSLESNLSTFSGHLQRILRILKQAKRGSLVLLDELGTGTDPEEGSALGRALLEVLLQRGALVIANTHLGALKLFSIELERAENASMEFDPLTLAPSFRLLVGVPGASHALEVAEQLGMPAELLARAKQLCTRSDGSEQLLVEVAEVRRHAEKMRERAREAEDDARLNLRSAEEQEKASRFRAELREREAQMAYHDLRARLSHLLEVESRAIQGQMSKDGRKSFKLFCSKLEAACTDSDLNQLWDVFIKGLSKGDIVYVPRYRERMRVVKMDRKRGRAKLQHGQLEIEVPIPELSWVEPPPGSDPPSF
ncbi:MAG: hypothetical protein COB96_03035 [Planctomycetota bacterium]|nr:MAG: hypothetical protein COB96_03035 [Planctomycetota bacterium]